MAQKQVHFYTLFQESPENPDLGQTGHFTLTYKTLLYAFGRQISGSDGLWVVEMKRRAVLEVGNHNYFSRDIVGDSPHGGTQPGCVEFPCYKEDFRSRSRMIAEIFGSRTGGVYRDQIPHNLPVDIKIQSG